MDEKVIYQRMMPDKNGILRFTDEQFKERREKQLIPTVWVGDYLGLVTSDHYRRLSNQNAVANAKSLRLDLT